MAVVSLGSITEFFGNNNKAITKGENAFLSNHLVKIKIDNNSKMIYADAEVQASMKKKIYKVSVSAKVHLQKKELFR